MLITGTEKTKKLDQPKTLIEKTGVFDELEAVNWEAYSDLRVGQCLLRVTLMGECSGRRFGCAEIEVQERE